MTGWLGLGDRRVVVAGGAGTIGAALVDGFKGAGAVVAVIDLAPDPGTQLAFAADLRDPEPARAAIDRAAEALGGLDVFVHCVGINNRKGIEDYSTQEWDDIVGINLSSAFHTAQAALAHMRGQEHGRLIFFSSVAGRSGHKHHGPYAATKAAINQLTRVIAHEYAAAGITANAVAPGYMDTALTERYLAEHPEKREELVRLIPAQRFGRLQEVVDPVLFLASERAGFINGQVLYIDGGRTVV
jgi:NAD(P)-dependent dehydrogenase (short-subunit alcohol dehydrogenase family)